MAIDPDKYNQKVYLGATMDGLVAFSTKEEAIQAANKQITENYLFWYVEWKTQLKVKDKDGNDAFETRNVHRSSWWF
jgi:hypothetical protein